MAICAETVRAPAREGPGVSRSLALQKGPGLALLEKWYIDVLLPDESVLIVYLFWMRLMGLATAKVAVEWSRSNGEAEYTTTRARTIRSAEDALLFGPAEIRGSRLTVKTPPLAIDLEFAPRHPAVRLVDPVYASDADRVTWEVEIPDSDVVGELTCRGVQRRLTGRGYRDRVFARVRPWRFPLETLRWGRAYAGDQASIWIEASSNQARLTASWRNGRLSMGSLERPSLSNARTLLDERIGIGPLLRWITPNAHQRRWLARAQNGADHGLAVHEEVRWR